MIKALLALVFTLWASMAGAQNCANAKFGKDANLRPQNASRDIVGQSLDDIVARGWMLFASSGSTGAPRPFRYTHVDRVQWSWANARGMHAMGFRKGETLPNHQGRADMSDSWFIPLAESEEIEHALLDAALASLGGIGAFVRPGESVVIKPNIGWDAPPERAANTHPELVGSLIALCLEAGAKTVSVFDNPSSDPRTPSHCASPFITSTDCRSS